MKFSATEISGNRPYVSMVKEKYIYQFTYQDIVHSDLALELKILCIL